VASGFIAGTAPVDITGDGKLKYNLSYLRVTTLFTPTHSTGFRARLTFSCLYKLACCVCACQVQLMKSSLLVGFGETSTSTTKRL